MRATVSCLGFGLELEASDRRGWETPTTQKRHRLTGLESLARESLVRELLARESLARHWESRRQLQTPPARSPLARAIPARFQCRRRPR
jgi:hypothetical protein